MKRYHYTPDNMVYMNDGVTVYNDTAANFEIDSGVPAVAPVPPYNDLDYDGDDLDFGEFRDNLNAVQPVKIEVDIPAIDALFAALAADVAAQTVRVDLILNPILDLGETKDKKKENLRSEAISRWSGVAPGFTLYHSMYAMIELYNSVPAPAPTVGWTLMLDVFAASEDAHDAINLLPSIAAVDAYDLVNDPAWP